MKIVRDVLQTVTDALAMIREIIRTESPVTEMRVEMAVTETVVTETVVTETVVTETAVTETVVTEMTATGQEMIVTDAYAPMMTEVRDGM